MSSTEILGFVPAPSGDIVVLYWPPVDGWMAINARQVRNPNVPQLVWMKPQTWKELANCATREGLFYIPCAEGLVTNSQLRQLVKQMESPHERSPENL